MNNMYISTLNVRMVVCIPGYIGALNKTREIRSSFLGKNIHDELNLKKGIRSFPIK